MPAFRFLCPSCGEETQKLTTSATNEIPCPCGQPSYRQLPQSTSSAVTEMRDRHRGVQLRKDHEQVMKKRMTNHHDRHDLEEKIDKYGLDDAVKHDWVKTIKKI